MGDSILGELEDSVTCWICFEVFHDPVTLACNHSFCKECLVKLFRKNPLCAFCRRPFGLPLPEVSRALEALVRAYQKQGQPPAAAAAPAGAGAAVAQSSALLRIPDELLLEVLALLAANDLGRAACVSRDLHRLATDGFLWRELARRQFPFCRPQRFGNDWRKCYVGTRRLQRGWTEGRPSDFKMVALRGHQNYVSCFSFYRNTVVSGSADNTVRVWDVGREEARHTLAGHAGLVTAVDFSELRIASASADATVRLWDTATGAQTAALHHDRAVQCLVFDEARVLSAGDDQRVKLWDVRTGQAARTYTGHHGPVHQLAVQGPHVVSRGADGVRVWDAASGNTLAALPPGACFALLPQRLLVAAGAQLLSYSLPAGAHEFSLATGGGAANVLAAEGSRAVVGCADHALRVLDLAGRRVLHTLADHSGPVQALQFDGRRLVSGADDNCLKVWDVASGRRLYSLLGGTLQRRANNPAHPTKPGCSGLRFDDGRIVASFQSLLRSYSFDQEQ